MKGIAFGLKENFNIEFLSLYSSENCSSEINSQYKHIHFNNPEEAQDYLHSVHQYKKDLIFVLGFANLWFVDVPRVVYIPDFQHEYYPNYFRKDELKNRKHQYMLEAATASALWFPSQSVEHDAKKFLVNLAPKRLRLAFPNFRTCSSESSFNQQLPSEKKILLCVSQNWPHKNLQYLIDEWARIPTLFKEKWQLNLVGKGVSALNLIPQDSLMVYESLNDTELNDLYKKAKLFVLPSSFEGWSTPVEEALASSVPMLLNDLSVLREQMPFGAKFFTMKEKNDFSKKLQFLLAHEKEIDRMKNDLKKVERSSLNQFYSKLIEFFNEVKE
jgi:glycosyltransferase involved in cell wall biosynthesis